LVLLFLETGMKSSEVFRVTTAHVDTSDPYEPVLWMRHRDKASKNDRKVKLPAKFVGVYDAYQGRRQVRDVLFPFSDKYLSKLFAALKARSGIQKELTAKTLRHTHVVQAYRRYEDSEAVFDGIGLAAASRQEAHEMYTRLAGRGM
jgi:integrase